MSTYRETAYTQMENFRFLTIADTYENWIANDPILLPNELAIVTDRRRLVIGTNDKFSKATELYVGVEAYNNLDMSKAVSIDSSIYKGTIPSGFSLSSGKRYKDYIMDGNGNLLYPITTAGSVYFSDGDSLATKYTNMNTKLTAIENGTIPAKTVTFGDGGSLQIVQSKDSLITELDLNNDSSTDTVLEITRSTDNGTTTTSLVKLSNAGALKVKTVEADNIFSKTTFAGFDIAVSDWVSSDSQWYYSKTLSGLDTSKDYFPIVLYSKDSTEIASIADATRAYITSGVLYIWAMAKPSTTLTVSKLYAIEA